MAINVQSNYRQLHRPHLQPARHFVVLVSENPQLREGQVSACPVEHCT